MSLHIYADVEQRSEEWHALRRGIVTASNVQRLLTPTLKVADNDTSRGLIATLAAERITGWTDDTFISDDMMRGIEHEPIARDLYGKHHAPAVEVGFMRRDGNGWSLGYSPDGLIGDEGLLEIKCPRSKAHLMTVLADTVPTHYMGQCQAALFVSGRKWLDYVSFVAGMPLWVKRVHPDPAWHLALTAAAEHAETAIAEMVAHFNSAVVGLPATERIDFNHVELKLA